MIRDTKDPGIAGIRTKKRTLFLKEMSEILLDARGRDQLHHLVLP